MSASEAQVADGRPFARAYVHAGMVGYEGEKMSKSKGNLVLVSTLRAEGVDPAAIRLALLAHHHRSDWEWTPEDLTSAEGRLTVLRDAVARGAGADPAETIRSVLEALATDLDAPAALQALADWAGRTLGGDDSTADAGERVRILLDSALGVRL
jgi:L-cysteine:1D-myo-inositol 2-amino-2-deoxy-alpha-D-glucopyranoside ligase